MHEAKATAKTPGHIIYLIDASESMEQPLEGERRIDHVHRALHASITELIGRSHTGNYFSSRYRVALIAYNETASDLLGGFLDIKELATLGMPTIEPSLRTDTHSGLVAARNLLATKLADIRDCPAPLVCHLTDAEFTHEDPEPIAQEIMEMRVADGPVLMENIYVGSDLPRFAVSDSRLWEGLNSEDELQNEFARKLFRMSSPMPESFTSTMRNNGYRLASGRRMFIPGTSADLVQLAFTISTQTGGVERVSP